MKLRDLAYYGSSAAYWHSGSFGGLDGVIVRPFAAIKRRYGLKLDDWEELEHWNKDDAKADGFKANAYKSDQLSKARGEAMMAIDAIVEAAKEEERKTTLTRSEGSLFNFCNHLAFRTGRDGNDEAIRLFTETAEEMLEEGKFKGELTFGNRMLDNEGNVVDLPEITKEMLEEVARRKAVALALKAEEKEEED